MIVEQKAFWAKEARDLVSCPAWFMGLALGLGAGAGSLPYSEVGGGRHTASQGEGRGGFSSGKKERWRPAFSRARPLLGDGGDRRAEGPGARRGGPRPGAARRRAGSLESAPRGCFVNARSLKEVVDLRPLRQSPARRVRARPEPLR